MVYEGDCVVVIEDPAIQFDIFKRTVFSNQKSGEINSTTQHLDKGKLYLSYVTAITSENILSYVSIKSR